MLLNVAHYYGNSGQTCKYMRGRGTFIEHSVISALQEAMAAMGMSILHTEPTVR